jgi:hypothetical protein
MKQLFTVMALTSFCFVTNAQNPTNSGEKKADTLRVGNMVIVKNGAKDTDGQFGSGALLNDSVPKPKDSIQVGNIIIVTSGEKNNGRSSGIIDVFERKNKKKQSNVSTNWCIVDIGFANYSDKTNYPKADRYLFNRAGAAPLGHNDFDLNTGKSINVNIWFFMQRLNLIKHYVNLKYGLGIELMNYRYKSQVSYLTENPFAVGVAPAPVIIRDSVVFSKNKLATDYVTIPIMLNFCTNPNNQQKGFSVSAGVSGGYLYSQRNKQISKERGKQKNHGGFDLEQFKISYIAEMGLGPVRVYGSYTPSSFYKRDLDMRPYAVGIRLSNW